METAILVFTYFFGRSEDIIDEALIFQVPIYIWLIHFPNNQVRHYFSISHNKLKDDLKAMKTMNICS